ncbi:MAG: DNA uptake protein-like [Geobacteraceae bacterium]|nr:MAG: DNA uptake protein-like [Geobacteraceae bacterium]
MQSRLLSCILLSILFIMTVIPAHARIVRVYTGKLNVNTASAADFGRLPEVGEVIAFRIVKERERRGTFKDVRELKSVNGISERVYEELKNYVAVSGENNLTVYMDLNTITRSLLLGIPGMTEGEARSILNYRKAKGRFAGMEELRLVPGINDRRFRELAEWLTVARR